MAQSEVRIKITAAFLLRARYQLALGAVAGKFAAEGAEATVELAAVTDATHDHEAIRRAGAKLSDDTVIQWVRLYAPDELRAELEEHLAEGRPESPSP